MKRFLPSSGGRSRSSAHQGACPPRRPRHRRIGVGLAAATTLGGAIAATTAGAAHAQPGTSPSHTVACSAATQLPDEWSNAQAYMTSHYGSGPSTCLQAETDVENHGGAVGHRVYDIRLSHNGTVYVAHVYRNDAAPYSDSVWWVSTAENQSAGSTGARSSDSSPDSTASPDQSSPDASPDQKAGPDNSPDTNTEADAKTPDPSSSGPERLAGSTRQGTAFAIATATYPGGVPSRTAVLAAGDDSHLVDSLAAAPLAKALGAPILLTQSAQTMGSAITAELRSLGVDKVVLVGALANPAIQSQLPSGVSVIGSYSGASRFGTAAQLAKALEQATGKTSFPTVFVSSGNNANLVDSLSAAPADAAQGAPLLLAPNPPTGTTITMPASEASIVSGASHIVQLGAVAADNIANASTAAHVERLGGATRYATSSAIDAAFFPKVTKVLIANGVPSHMVDALAAGPLGGDQQAPLLLTQDGVVSPSGQAYLSALGSSATFVIVGGSASIPVQNGQ